ncbi:MAG: ABC transporter permease subunit [Terracidiphilus sp.]|jgi:ABC-type dipeptide/oligopeptide/nickel transport system permease subunit
MKKRIPAVFLLLVILAGGLVLRVSRYGYAFQDRGAIMAPSTAEHWTGTDELGRDRTVRVAAALFIGLMGAAAAAAITTAIAACFGLLAAFSPSSVAALLMFLSDGFLSLPWLFLLMMARSLLPLTASPLETAVTTFLVLAALGWPACAHAIYRGARSLRSAEWMIQGRACGLKSRQLIRLHIVPHLRPLLLPQFLVCVPAFLVAEANLGALGLGVGEPMPSWGAMLLELDNSALLARSHWVYLPIALLALLLLILESFAEVETHA